MKSSFKPALVAAALVVGLAQSAETIAQTYSKNNGIISFNANVHGVPMISDLSVLGTVLVPYDTVGAGFQMTGRSALGNAYNPTQAGDCTQTPSRLDAAIDNWGGNNIGLPATNGLQLQVTPRNYNEPSTCLGVGNLLPYNFAFGATLGDGTILPREAMLLEMSITRLAGSEVLEKAQSELPSIFQFAQVLPRVYWSADGATFQQFTVNINGTYTNDIRAWPYGVNYGMTGKSVMVCTNELTMCVALYSNKTTGMLASHRAGAAFELSLLTLTADTSGQVSDFQSHIGRKLLAVGTPATVQAVISAAQSTISDWGDL